MTNPVLVPSYHPPTMVGGELTTGLSNLCAPVFECTTVLLYAFCDEHSLIRIVYCSTIGNLHIYAYSGISTVTFTNLYLSIYSTTVPGTINLSTSVVHVVLVVVHSSLNEKCRIGRPSVVEYGNAGGTQKTQRAQFVSPKCCSLCRYQSCCCCSFWHDGFE